MTYLHIYDRSIAWSRYVASASHHCPRLRGVEKLILSRLIAETVASVLVGGGGTLGVFWRRQKGRIARNGAVT
jgi:hypothetical protein